MSYQGYCYSCRYEGSFDSRNRCPKCKARDIVIYMREETEIEYQQNPFKKYPEPHVDDRVVGSFTDV